MPRKLIDAEVVEIRPKDALSPAIEIKLAGETFPRLRVNADGSLYSGAGTAEPATAIGSLAADYEAAIERLVLTMAAAETRPPLVINDSTGAAEFAYDTAHKAIVVGGDWSSGYTWLQATADAATFELQAANNNNQVYMQAVAATTSLSMTMAASQTASPFVIKDSTNAIKFEVDENGAIVKLNGADKPTGVAVTAEGIHAALVTLGLIAA